MKQDPPNNSSISSSHCPRAVAPLSALWGCEGELWARNDPATRLLDWSYAGVKVWVLIPHEGGGYHYGWQPLSYTGLHTWYIRRTQVPPYDDRGATERRHRSRLLFHWVS